jgi:L-cysteine S-thiosulfotransferase
VVHRILGAAFIIFMAGTFGGAPAVAEGRWRAEPPADASNPLKQLVPAKEFLPPTLRAQETDDFDNPAYPLVEAGEIAWRTLEGEAGKSCQDCHGAGRENALKRIAASYPKFTPDIKQVITLEARINLCRQNHLKAPRFLENADQMIAMAAYLRWLARGSASNADVTGPSAEVFARGAKLFQTKLGLLQLSCAQCHNEKFGEKFGADILSQGHPLSYPVYKLSEGRAVSLHERFRMCNRLARAEGRPDNAPDYVALELYINWRSKNLPITAPGVRP